MDGPSDEPLGFPTLRSGATELKLLAVNNQTEQMKRYLLALLLFTFTNMTFSQSNIWHELLRGLQFADTIKASLEFQCNQNLRYRTIDRLIEVCEKREKIPDYVIESAALPYLMKHISKSMARQALAQVSSETWQCVGRKLITELATGKHDQLTPEDIVFLDKENRSEIGKILSAFATDKEQGIAVFNALMAY